MTTIFDQSMVGNGGAGISAFIHAESFTLSTSYTLTGGAASISDGDFNDNGQLDNFSGTLSWAIFSNDAGQPGTLLYSGQDDTLTFTDTNAQTGFGDAGIVSFDFGGLALSAGTYFLALHEGNWGSAFDSSDIYWNSSTTTGGSHAATDISASPTSWSTVVGDLSFSLQGTTDIVVSTTADEDDGNYSAGHLSLREAIKLANANADANTIKFDAALAGQTITLDSAFGELSLTQDVTIDGDVNGDNKADITISGNDAVRILNITGGKTDVDLLSLTLRDGNAGTGQGGAISATSGYSASSGKLFYGISSLDLRDVSIVDNTAEYGGGASVNARSFTATDILVTGNSANQFGGLYISITTSGSATLVNATIDGNSASGHGGGIAIYGYSTGTVNIVNSTVTNNTAGTYAGGIHRATGTLNIVNSVVAENTASLAPDVNGTIATATNSVFGSDVSITTATNVQESVTDIGLGALADNGGTVMTRNIDSYTSPLFNAGSNAAVAGIGTDANGNPRIAAGTVDIGATEHVLSLVVTTADDVVDANDGVLSLREALTLANLGDDANTITFDATLAGQTITLNSYSGQLRIREDVTINGDVNGDGKADITISGGGNTRIFNITGYYTNASLHSLTLTGGNAGYSAGGAIQAYGAESLELKNTTIANSRAMTGGGLYARETDLAIINSLFSGNYASSDGGGLAIYRNSTLSLTNSTIHGNQAGGSGGGMWVTDSTASIVSCTITGNQADAGGTGFHTGGGVYTTDFDLSLYNSVVAGNTQGYGAVANDVSGVIETAVYSVFGTDVAISTSQGVQEQVSNIGLGELLDNGGTVLTLSPLDGSVLINSGSFFALPLDTFDIDNDGNTTEFLPLDGRGGIRLSRGGLDIGAVDQRVNEKIIGTDAANTIIGGRGDDLLRGRDGNDTISGDNGKDNLAGGDGADTLDGGTGRDTAVYIGSGLGVTIDLAAGAASGGHADGDTLANIENLTGSGFDDSLSGNALTNVLSGGAGDDRLNGSTGHDTLTGGLGADTFVLTRLSTSSDTISDFETGVDILEISATAAGLGAGTLNATRFAFNAAGTAEDPGDRIVYNTTTGELSFDRNGSDAGGSTIIAILQGATSLAASDIFIV